MTNRRNALHHSMTRPLAAHAWTDQPVLPRPGIRDCPNELQRPFALDPLGELSPQSVVIERDRTISLDLSAGRSLQRTASEPGPPLDAPTAPVENRSCVRKTSGPTAAAEPA